MKNLRPKFIENSKIPIILSKIAPIEIWAINIGPLVFCRGALSEDTKRHESIHFQQQIELLFIFHFILYFLFWIVGAIRYKNMKIAYAAATFAEILRRSPHADEISLEKLLKYTESAKRWGQKDDIELLALMDKARQLGAGNPVAKR